MRYRKSEMKRILRQDIKASAVVEAGIQEAYSVIRADAASRQEERRQMSCHGKTFSRRWAAVAAVVGVLAVSSVTVMAISGIFSKNVEQSGETLSYQLEFNYELTPDTVEAEVGYIPEGYSEVPNTDGTKWCADDSYQNGISIMMASADYLDAEPEALDAENVKSMEKTTINGMEAHLIVLDCSEEQDEKYFDKRIYLFNETEGYVCVVFGGNDLSMEELKKVAEGLTFTKTGQSAEYMSSEEKEIRDASAQDFEKQWQESRDFGVPQEYIYDIGTGFEYQQLKTENTTAEGVAKITVESVEMIDSVADYPQENFFDYAEDVELQLNGDGTAKPYTRVTYDGSGEEIAREESVNRKFLKVTVKAENISESAIDYWAGAGYLAHLEPMEEGNYKYPDTYTEPLNWQEDSMSIEGGPIYFDQSPYAGELNGHFFWRELAVGETLEYTLLYVVDEDQMDNLYLKYSSGSAIPLELDGTFSDRYVRLDTELNISQ
ncbi:MAG: DUF4367 domain-containing protein [Eubacteriales bacterium]|nr:DUF4367 domain-containing protein [Eubacteriales bacterium]